jgi:hypothetical protein
MGMTVPLIRSEVVSSHYDAFWEDAETEDKNVRLLVVLQRAEVADPALATMLDRMVAGFGLGPDDTAKVVLNDGVRAAWYRLEMHHHPKVVLTFGIEPGRLGISALFTINEVNRFGGCIWLPCVPLAAIAADDKLKRQLWDTQMKPLFKEGKFGPI